MGTMTRDKSCEERIEQERADRFAQFKEALDACEANDYDEDAEGPNGETLTGLRESLLEFTPRISVRLLLSTGGPADGFDIVVDDGEVVSGTYFFQDWFDGARRDLTSDELQVIEQVYGPFDLRISQ